MLEQLIDDYSFAICMFFISTLLFKANMYIVQRVQENIHERSIVFIGIFVTYILASLLSQLFLSLLMIFHFNIHCFVAFLLGVSLLKYEP